MKRRTFFKWIGGIAAFFTVPNHVHARPAPAAAEAATLHDVAEIVLPESLGVSGIETAVAGFEAWIHDYRAGAEMSSGYGFTKLRVEPPNPSSRYAVQLQQLNHAALTSGSPFASASATVRRRVVQQALTDAHVTAIPRRPDGMHVAADLMAYFFFISSDGHDFLYDAAIRRNVCRGLKSSATKPAPLS